MITVAHQPKAEPQNQVSVVSPLDCFSNLFAAGCQVTNGDSKSEQEQSFHEFNSDCQLSQIDTKNDNQFSTSVYNKSIMKVLQRKNGGNKKHKGSFSDQVHIDEKSRDMEREVQQLQRRLDKKDELIRYLERKCGQQIIKSTARLYKRLSQLEEQNKILKITVQKQQKGDNIKFSKLTAKMDPQNIKLLRGDGELRKELQKIPESDLHEIILNQSFQIDQLLQKLEGQQKKLIHSTQHNKELKKALATQLQDIPRNSHRRNLSLSDSSFRTIGNENIYGNINGSLIQLETNSSKPQHQKTKICTPEQGQSPTENNQKQLSREPLLCMDIQIQTQLAENFDKETETEQDRDQANIKQENQSLKITNQRLNRQLESLSERIGLWQQKLKQEIVEQMPEMGLKNQIQMNYYELLDIFGIEWGQYESSNDIQELLLTEINNLKQQLGRILKEFKKLEKQMMIMHQQKLYYQRAYQEQRPHMANINEVIFSLQTELEQSNDQLMRHKTIILNSRYSIHNGSQQPQIRQPLESLKKLDKDSRKKTSPEDEESNEMSYESDDT